MNRRPISPASKEQRAKVAGTVCRICGHTPVHPAHVISRAQGGCNAPVCVISLCPEHHRLFDDGGLEVLGVLTKEEQAHAVGHVGIMSALHRTTHLRWAPEEYGKEPDER